MAVQRFCRLWYKVLPMLCIFHGPTSRSYLQRIFLGMSYGWVICACNPKTVSVCLHFAVLSSEMAARVAAKFGAKAVCVQENLSLQVESAVATVEGSSDDLQKCATAINDLAYKVCGCLCAFAQQCFLCKSCCSQFACAAVHDKALHLFSLMGFGCHFFLLCHFFCYVIWC